MESVSHICQPAADLPSTVSVSDFNFIDLDVECLDDEISTLGLSVKPAAPVLKAASLKN